VNRNLVSKKSARYLSKKPLRKLGLGQQTPSRHTPNVRETMLYRAFPGANVRSRFYATGRYDSRDALRGVRRRSLVFSEDVNTD